MRLRTGLKGSPWPLLEGNDELLAEEDGDLLVAILRGVVDHAEDDEGMVLEEVDLRTLAGIDDVLERQRVQPEDAADLGDQLDVSKADAIEPDDRPLAAGLLDVGEADISEEMAFLERNHRQAERRLHGLRIGDQRSRRGADR